MKSIYSTLALAFAACTLAVDYNTVNDDISNISNLLGSLSTDAKAIVAGVNGLPTALDLQVDAVNLHTSILTSIDHANALPKFGTVGSLSIGVSFIALAPKIVSTLQVVAGKNATLGDLGVVVLSSLYQLKQDTDSFGKVVVTKLDVLEAVIAPPIIKIIDDAFNSAIVAYGGKSEHYLFLSFSPICLLTKTPQALNRCPMGTGRGMAVMGWLRILICPSRWSTILDSRYHATVGVFQFEMQKSLEFKSPRELKRTHRFASVELHCAVTARTSPPTTYSIIIKTNEHTEVCNVSAGVIMALLST